MGPVPLHCFAQCHAGRGLWKSKLPHCLSWINELVPARQAHLIRSGRRYAVGVQPGDRHVYVGPALRHPVWNAEAHLGPSGNLGEQVEDLLECEVFSTQDVSLAYLPPFCGQQVTCRHSG